MSLACPQSVSFQPNNNNNKKEWHASSNIYNIRVYNTFEHINPNMLCFNGDTFILNGMASVCVSGISHHHHHRVWAKKKRKTCGLIHKGRIATSNSYIISECNLLLILQFWKDDNHGWCIQVSYRIRMKCIRKARQKFRSS